jgi:hypothetical protein
MLLQKADGLGKALHVLNEAAGEVEFVLPGIKVPVYGSLLAAEFFEFVFRTVDALLQFIAGAGEFVHKVFLYLFFRAQ